MTSSIKIKICGVKTEEIIKSCVDNGVAFLGFNFVDGSPRYIEPRAAGALAGFVPPSVAKVALTVDAEDALLDAIMKEFPADIIQLHGIESPARVEAIKARFNKPVIKAISIFEADDLEEITAYEGIADYFLFDARPPMGSDLPGGNAVPFDWGLAQKAKTMKPWFLAGGINEKNIKEAIAISGAYMVDIASGVESEKGVKDKNLIASLMKAVNTF
jgi:phosphoribosylanthranilate isomerase